MEDYWVCDGTFEMAPESAYQLYTIHGFFNGETLALVWALLPNKNRQTYEEMLTAVHQELMIKFVDRGGSSLLLNRL